MAGWDRATRTRRAARHAITNDREAGKATFLIPHTWPDIRNAEYEVLKRLAIAAENIGSTMIAVDNDGLPLWASRKMYLDKSKRIDGDSADFMLSLHFESPRLLDIYSYYAAWQPLQFYRQFGYDQSTEKMLTHNDWVSCDSKLADAHARNLFAACRPEPSGTPPQLFHSPPRPYHEPKITAKSRPFYVGINWERISGQKGRHHDLLVRLDEEELVDIYGPKKFLGAEPWRGFKSYRGELPFDGRSVVRAQHESGICLALSSEAHRASGLMSNRLFEGLAGGAAIIADSNRFVEEHFSDVVYFVDEEASQEDLFFQIKTIVEEIRSNPERAIARARKGQERLAERFSLEGCLQSLIDGHGERVRKYHAVATKPGSVTIIIVYAGNSLETLLGTLDTATAQVGVQVEIALVCDKMFLNVHRAEIEGMLSVAQCGLTTYPCELTRFEATGENERPRPVPTGPAVADALAGIKTDYFCFLRSDEDWFRDHLTTLIAGMERSTDASMCVSGALSEIEAPSLPPRRQVASMRLDVDEVTLLTAKYDADPGRFLFRRGILASTPLACLPVLDGQEHTLIRLTASLAGPIAHSGYATYIAREADTKMLPSSILGRDDQQQYIRDAFAFNPRWQGRMAALASMHAISQKTDFKATTRWGNYSHPRNVVLKLPLGVVLPMTEKGVGTKYLGEGFSMPEANFTWIEGEKGIIEFACSPEEAAESLEEDLVFEMVGRPSEETGRQQHCMIVVNGVSLAYVPVPDVKTEIKVRIPRLRHLAKNGWVKIEIVPDHSELVYDDDGKVADPRRLSVALYSLEVRSLWRSTPQVFSSNRVYLTNTQGEGVAGFVDGFSDPEATGTWMIGKEARIQFKVDGFAPPMSLRLRLRALKSSDGAEQRTSVRINGREAISFAVPSQPTDCIVPLTKEAVSGDGICRITFSFLHAESVKGQSGAIHDDRLLAAHLFQFEIVRGNVGKSNGGSLVRTGKRIRRSVLRRLSGSGSR